MTPASALSLGPVLAMIALALFGLLFGVLLSLLGGLAYSLNQSARAQQASISAWRQEIGKVVADSSLMADRLRLDLLAALSKLDADRLALASHAIQRSAQSLTTQTQALAKLLYASNPAANPAMLDPLGNMTREAFSMEEEADDDARMLAERERWQQQAAANAVNSGWQTRSRGPFAGPPVTNLTYAEDLTDEAASTTSHDPVMGTPDIFAGLTQTEKQQAIDAFWAARRAGIGGSLSAAETLSRAAAERAGGQPGSLPDLHGPSDLEVMTGVPDATGPVKSEMEE